MTEFQELVKDAPEFASMERGELVIYAYAIYASGAKMEAENAKLRYVESENASLRGAVQGLGELCDKYKAENAKLRELVAIMPRCWGDECMDCPMGVETTARGVFGCKAEDMLREMGFEVGE